MAALLIAVCGRGRINGGHPRLAVISQNNPGNMKATDHPANVGSICAIHRDLRNTVIASNAATANTSAARFLLGRANNGAAKGT